MKRRAFLHTGFAAGVLGAGAGTVGTVALPTFLGASPRRLAGGSVRLNSNENPLGISPSARHAILEGLDMANRYPGDSRTPVVEAVAQKHGVGTENLVMGAGSTEVLQMAVQMMGPDVQLVIADPTFEDVWRYATPWSLKVEKVPLLADYSHDLGRMRDIVRRWNGPSLVYVCNPNNPTATLTSSAAVDEWIESAPDNVFFLVDEAYYEYAESQPNYWSALKYVKTNPNVMVARTFSKIYAMAGLRLGYGVGHASMIEKIGFLASRNNANHLACVAAVASLEDDGLIERSVHSNAHAKKIVEDALDELGIERLPSYANFMMHRIKGDLADYRNRMAEQGWLVGRPFPPMLSYNRVSFSTPDDMERFAETLRDFRSRGWV